MLETVNAVFMPDRNGSRKKILLPFAIRREAVTKSGAYSTDMENPENVNDLTAKCETVAEKWAPVADELWECSGHCSRCGSCK